MSFQIKILEADQLDLKAYSILQQQSFAEVFNGAKVDGSHLDSSFFEWKYNTPAGKARIAVAEENGEMLASVAMYPVKLIEKDKLFKSWHFVEAATLPKARGKGMFKKCMQALMDTLQNDELIYVSPNKNSLSATKNIGFKESCYVPFYCKLVFNLPSKPVDNFGKQLFFDSNQDSYAEALALSSHRMVLRSSEYMNWRYNAHPHVSYYSLSPVRNGKIQGNIVLRPVQVKQKNLLLIMEFHTINSSVEREMLDFLGKVAKSEKCIVAGIFSRGAALPAFSSSGLIKVPGFFIPKKHIVMEYRKTESLFPFNDWFMQTGDWDAF